MAITNEAIKHKIKLMLENVQQITASLENQQATIEIKKELLFMQEKLEGMQIKMEEEESEEYRLQREEQEERLDEENEELKDQQQETNEQLKQVLNTTNTSPLAASKTPANRDVKSLRQRFTTLANSKKSQQEFENSKPHIKDEILSEQKNYNKDLGIKLEQKGVGSLNYSKTLKESQMTKCANDSSQYALENLFTKSPGLSTVPRPENNEKVEEEASYYFTVSPTHT